jgi:DNA polymerase-4
VSPDRVDKSIGAETTFDVDVDDPDVIRRTLLSLSTRVGARLRTAGHAGRTVAIKVRLADFRTLNRSRTLPTPTDVARDIFDTAWQLYRALDPSDRIRLIGVRVEGLDGDDGAARQLELGEREHGWRDAERAADAAAARFGRGAVGPASLLGRDVRGRPMRPLQAAVTDKTPAGSESDPGRHTDVAERDFDPLSDPLRPS